MCLEEDLKFQSRMLLGWHFDFGLWRHQAENPAMDCLNFRSAQPWKVYLGVAVNHQVCGGLLLSKKKLLNHTCTEGGSKRRKGEEEKEKEREKEGKGERQRFN